VILPTDVAEKKIALTRTMGAYRSSMQIDRLAGRKLESEAIIGRPLRIAQAAQVDVPLMELLYFALAAESA
jgi:2-dehydropantoate 2-reductase